MVRYHRVFLPSCATRIRELPPCYRTCHSSCLKPRTAPSARGVPIPTSVMQPAILQCSLRIAPTICDHRSCHRTCLKPGSPPTAHGIPIPTANQQTSWRSPCALPQLSRNLLEAKFPASCCWRCNPNGQPATDVALLAIYRTCHRKCKYGEHFLRHVLVTPSASNPTARQQSPVAQDPALSQNLLEARFTANAPSGTRKLVLPTGTKAPLAAPLTTFLRSRNRQMPPRSCPGLSTPGERSARHLQSWTTIIASRDDRPPLNMPCHPNVERQPIITDSRTLHIAAPQYPRAVMPVAGEGSNSHANAPNRNVSDGILRARQAVADMLNPPPWFSPLGTPLSEAPPFKRKSTRGENPSGGKQHRLSFVL